MILDAQAVGLEHYEYPEICRAKAVPDIRSMKSSNVETSGKHLRTIITPNAAFFTRSHFEIPAIDAKSWELRIDGDVRRPRAFSYVELKDMPQHSVAVTLECAGNSRVRFGKVAAGEVPWGDGAVGTAVWTGVPVATLLGDMAPARQTTHIIVEGEDEGPQPGSGKKIHFARALPIGKALDPDCIVALAMNSKTLPVAHGFPARLIVPGWYGMASIKWLRRITVAARGAFEGYFFSSKYNYATKRGIEPVREIRVKSLVNSPLGGQTLKRYEPFTITGKAWSGIGAIIRVEVSINGKWIDAALRPPAGVYEWTEWSLKWSPARLGRNLISVRATDSSNNIQPLRPFQNLNQYGYNAVQTTEVHVET